MSDDEKVCCVLGICCPSGGQAQREALTLALAAAYETSKEPIGEPSMRSVADYIIDHFDLAPKDSLKALKAGIVRMVRGKG